MSENSFKKISLFTIWAVYFLILVGGIVRSMEAGMGCPDWPKCFGKYVPPTSNEQLPDDYKERFLEERMVKNDRLVGLLSGIGMEGLATRITSDPMIRVEEDFSPVKAWVEYINRLIGVVIGFCIIGTALSSLQYRRSRPTITILATASLLLVIFQGWIGSLVVSTNLLPGFVSFHMVLALLLVALLIYAYHLAGDRKQFADNKVRTYSLVLFLMLLPQLLLGTQVREAIDSLKAMEVSRINWIANLDWPFYVHRSYSLVLMALATVLVFRIRKNGWISNIVGKLSLSVLGLMILLAVGGAVMAYFNVPAFIQPLHLIMGALLFGFLFFLVLQTRKPGTTS